MKCLPIVIMLLINLRVLSAGMQPPGNGDTLLTLSGVVEFAADSSISIRSGRNGIQSSFLNVLSTKNALYPSAQTGLSAKKPIDPSGPTSAGASVGISYDLSAAQYVKHIESRKQLTASEYDLTQKKNDLAVEAILQYVKIICAADLITVEEKNVEYQNHKLDEINALFEHGAKSRTDVLQQQSTIAQVQLQLLNAHQEYQRNKLILLDMLGIPLSDRYRFDTTEVVLLKNKFIQDSSETKFTGQIEKDAITAQKYSIAAEEARLQSCRLSYIPSLGVSAGWSAGWDLSDITRSADDPSTSLQVSASLSIPLFDNKKRWLQVKNAELDLDDARLKLEELRQSTDLAIAQAALEDAMATDRIIANRVRLATAKEALMAMEERYTVGASTLSELNTVQADYIEAQSAFVQSEFDRTISRITLLHETGRTDEIYRVLHIGSLEKRF